MNYATVSSTRCTRVLDHIIIRGIERRAIFRDDFDRENFLERLSIMVPETQTSCYAWVFMSNHYI